MKHKSTYISESFKSRADTSAFWEAWVGAKLSRGNLYTVHHPFTLSSETGNPLSFYAHTWDLDVSVDKVNCLPVEVKSVNLKFTFPNDYPHLGILVCSDSSWQKKWPGTDVTQRDFLLVSRETGAIVWLPKGAPVIRKMQKDPSRGEEYLCVATHKAELRSFNDFMQYVKEQTLAF